MHGRKTYFTWFLLLAVSLHCVQADDSPYTVKEKETLFTIARRNQIPMDVLCRINGIQDPARIKAGTVLNIPRAHVVGKGDTLFAISRQYGVSLENLLSFNGLTDPGRIKTGDKIYLPPASDAAAAASSRTAPAASAVQKPETSPPVPAAPQKAAAGGPERHVASWPHPGRREALQGKVVGLAFYGKQGDDVLSVTNGEVKWVGPYWGLGKVIIVQTEDGDQILYAGNETLLVNKGDIVNPGMSIARLGLNPEGVARLSFSILTVSGKFVEPERISKG